MVALREITEKNLIPFLKMKVKDTQTDLVASNAVSIAQAHYSDKAWYRGIFADETPVGFVMLSLDHEKEEYWIWRFMIDRDHQGKGYGKQALKLILRHMRTLPDIKEALLSYMPKEKVGAGDFYRKAGFVDTGRMEDDEVVLKFVFNFKQLH